MPNQTERPDCIGEVRGSNPLSSTYIRMFYIYNIQSERGNRYYIGSTKGISRRITEHNQGKNNSTKTYRPWKLVYCECFQIGSG
jgi:predicted GIY-YIG superfamily endonuclease